uniref:Uncharacterized protein n=1 Tax=Aegilops tauschii subsp. strangulata TaxID=200361 RepID=A0A453GF53_AEGTS
WYLGWRESLTLALVELFGVSDVSWGQEGIVIGQEYAVSIMAIDNEEESNEKSI